MAVALFYSVTVVAIAGGDAFAEAIGAVVVSVFMSEFGALEEVGVATVGEVGVATVVAAIAI